MAGEPWLVNGQISVPRADSTPPTFSPHKSVDAEVVGRDLLPVRRPLEHYRVLRPHPCAIPFVGATGLACCACEGHRIEETREHDDCSCLRAATRRLERLSRDPRSDLIWLKSRRRLNGSKPHEPPPLQGYLCQESCPWQESNSFYCNWQYFTSSSFPQGTVLSLPLRDSSFR